MADEVPAALRRIARDLRDATVGFGRSAGGELRERHDDARAELARLLQQIEDIVEHRLQPVAREASRDAREVLDDGREVALDAAARLRDATRTHPFLAIGIAVAATWVVTSLLRGRR